MSMNKWLLEFSDGLRTYGVRVVAISDRDSVWKARRNPIVRMRVFDDTTGALLRVVTTVGETRTLQQTAWKFGHLAGSVLTDPDTLHWAPDSTDLPVRLSWTGTNWMTVAALTLRIARETYTQPLEEVSQ